MMLGRILVMALSLAAWPALAKLRVVATVSDLGAIAREVAGAEAEVEVLARPTQDPHFVDAKPSLVLALARADLVLVMGMELEVGWMPVLLTQSRNGKVQPGARGYLDCSTLISPLEVPVQKLDRSMGDIHPGGNPHYTKDPRNAAPLADGIAARMAELQPDQAAAFRAGADRFKRALEAQLQAWGAAFQPFRGTPVVTFHKSWIYFTAWAGLTEVAFIEPKPGIPPSPSHVAAVLQVIRSRKVPLILQEQWYSAAVSEQLARLSGARLVRVPGMTPEGKGYLEHMGEVVDQTVKALEASQAQGRDRAP
jgi:zinc/manganese transport system substrate-binding protein